KDRETGVAVERADLEGPLFLHAILEDADSFWRTGVLVTRFVAGHDVDPRTGDDRFLAEGACTFPARRAPDVGRDPVGAPVHSLFRPRAVEGQGPRVLFLLALAEPVNVRIRGGIGS